MIAQAHLYIKGQVIGVGFRAWTKIQARLNRITGWVKNVYNKPKIFGLTGGVEAVIQGEKTVLNKMIKIIKRGPAVARVDQVIVKWEKPTLVFRTFDVVD